MGCVIVSKLQLSSIKLTPSTIKYLPVFGELTGTKALLSECGVTGVLRRTLLQLPLISEFFLDTRKNSSWKRGDQRQMVKRKRNKHAMIEFKSAPEIPESFMPWPSGSVRVGASDLFNNGKQSRLLSPDPCASISGSTHAAAEFTCTQQLGMIHWTMGDNGKPCNYRTNKHTTITYQSVALLILKFSTSQKH